MRRPPVLQCAASAAAALVALVALLVVVAGCGDGAAPSSSPTVFDAAMAGSQDLGFRMQYPAGYVQAEPDVAGSEDPSLLYQVYLADPTGARSGETALDVLGVSVHRMSKPAGADDVRRHRAEFKAMASALIGDLEGLRVVRPFRVTEFAGHQALEASYVYRIGEADVAVLAYLIPVGDRVFWVTGQASRETWDTAGRELGSAMATLQLEPVE